jgi:hypothetical protein
MYMYLIITAFTSELKGHTGRYGLTDRNLQVITTVDHLYYDIARTKCSVMLSTPLYIILDVELYHSTVKKQFLE